MNKTLFKGLKSCINAMRRDNKRNWVIGLSSNPYYGDACFLDVFRIGPNNYTVKFDSPKKGCSWTHTDVSLRLVDATVQTWYDDIKAIDKYKYMEY